MAISISLSLLPSAGSRLLCTSFSNNRRFSSPFFGQHVPWRKYSLSYHQLCCLSTAIPQKYLQEEDLKEELINQIREDLSSFVVGTVNESLDEALELVDMMQGLGIQRFFKLQIEGILKSAYSQYWDQKYGFIGVNATLLGFRVLRLHGYHVSADVLKTLKDKDNGNFSTFSMATIDKISGLLNLYKCSQMGFPRESDIMDEAQVFSYTQLTQILSDVSSCHLLDSKQIEEIEFVLAFPRQCLLPRTEARSLVRRYWPSSGLKRRCLELACIDLETLQKLYQQEMNELERWLDKQCFKDITFPRNRYPKLFICAAMSMFEPQFSVYRTTFTRICCLVAITDDLFDHSTSDHHCLYRLHDAFERWDLAPVENLPQHNAIFKSFQQTLEEIAAVASADQGRDVLPCIVETWQDLVSAFMKEAEWTKSSNIPSLEEYLQVAVTSVSAVACLSTFIFLLGEPVTSEAYQFIGKDSRILYLASLISRLANDIATNEREETEGKFSNVVECYMKDQPECTREDANIAIKEMIKTSFREMEEQMFLCRGIVPECCIRAVLGWVQATCITYRKLDGYKSMMDTEYEDLVRDFMGY